MPSVPSRSTPPRRCDSTPPNAWRRSTRNLVSSSVQSWPFEYDWPRSTGAFPCGLRRPGRDTRLPRECRRVRSDLRSKQPGRNRRRRSGSGCTASIRRGSDFRRPSPMTRRCWSRLHSIPRLHRFHRVQRTESCHPWMRRRFRPNLRLLRTNSHHRPKPYRPSERSSSRTRGLRRGCLPQRAILSWRPPSALHHLPASRHTGCRGVDGRRVRAGALAKVVAGLGLLTRRSRGRDP